MRNLFALPDKLIPDRLSKELLSKDVIENYKKPAIIVGSLVGSILVGTLVVRKIYFNKINDLVDETRRREDERNLKVESDATKPIRSIKEQHGQSHGQSSSVPTTPSTDEPLSPGLSILVDKKPQSNSLSNDGISVISQLGRRKRPLNSICSYQLNLQINTPLELILFSNDYVKRALKVLEDVKSRNKDFEVQNADEFEQILQDTRTLIERIQSFTKHSQVAVEQQQKDAETEDSPPFGSPEGSIASTLYSFAFFDVEPNIHFFKLYTNSLENLEKIVRPRVDRSQLVNCETLDEFYAKVNCIRGGFQAIFSEQANRDYFAQIGEYILKVLMTNQKDQNECLEIYADMIAFVSDEENFSIVNEELASRKIPILSFYDLVLDYIILDSFDDLENPPSSIVSVANQRWFGDTFKIRALQTAISIVLKHKRSKLKVTDGFFSRFYTLMDKISPRFAWGFFGTDTDLKFKCNFIKQAILEVVRDFFDFDRVRYTSTHDLTIDMLTVVDIRYDDLKGQISIINMKKGD